MIKRFLLIFVVILLLVQPLTAYGDVVFSNDFLTENENKVELVSRRFYMNSPSGYVIPKLEPGSEKLMVSGRMYTSIPWGDVYPLANGEIIYITCTYLHNGEYWGVLRVSHSYRQPGWILMDELLMIYDRKDFEEEHQDEFYTYTGNYNKVLAAKQIVFWEWPGSDREKRIVDYNDFTIIEINTDCVYKDGQERVWGYADITYEYISTGLPPVLHGYDRGWICLSDPENSEISAFNPAPKPIKWLSDDIPDWSSNKDTIIWPSVDIWELMSASKPQSAFKRPFENEFRLQHEKDLQKLDRNRFYVNGPDGYVIMKTAPDLAGQVLTHWASGILSYPNEAELIIEYVYIQEGEYWGYIEDSPDNPGYYPPGWIPMDHLVVRYANNDFINEHREEFYPYEGDILTAITTDTFVIWEWPGSDRESVVWDSRRLEDRTPITKEAYKSIKGQEWVYDYEEACEWLYIENAYKDGQEREWIYIETYWNDDVKGWICISDPENREIPAFNPSPKQVKWSPDGIYEWIHLESSDNTPSKNGLSTSLSIAILVTVLIAGTAVLIKIFWKPNKTNQGGKSDD